MATIDDVMTAIRNADAAGDSDSVRKLGGVLQQMQTATQRQAHLDALMKSNPAEYDPSSPEWQAKNNPTNGMSTTDKVLAGAGKAFVDTGRGIGQLLRHAMPDSAADALGLPTQADIDQAKQLDAPLMQTGAGKVGNIAGHVAVALPTMFIPGVNTVAGSGAVGAAMGAVQPVASDESRLKNTVVGGALGAAAPVVARTVAAGYQGAKSLVEPFTQSGRDAIAARTLTRFGVDPAAAANVSSQPTVTGALPTLAEQITDPTSAAGAARLQDAMRSADPQIASQFATREAQNNAARVATLTDMAGTDGARDFAVANRAGTAQQLYDTAFQNGMPALSKAQQAQMDNLLKMPAIQDAMKTAQENAANRGASIASPNGSIQGLHDMKLALDDQVANLSNGSVSQVNRAKAVAAARDKLVSFLQDVSPDYAAARQTYADMSQPVNQMDIANTLFRKGTSATSNLDGTPRLMPNQFIGQLKNEEQLVKGATGRDLGTLSQVLDPEQFAKVQAIGQELDKSAAVARAANGPGSPTAQRLASQNVLRQVLGPTGLPQSWAESTLLNTAMRPVQFAYNGVAEPKIQAVLADLLLNPAKAQAAMQAAQSGGMKTLPAEVQAALPYLAQALKTSVPAAALSSQR